MKAAAQEPSPPVWRVAFHLARASNLPTVWANMGAAWFLNGQVLSHSLWLALVGGTLAYAGGCTLNDAFDAQWDRQHRPERPIPSGKIAARTVWWLGSLELALGCLLLAVSGAHPGLCVLLASFILFYDWCHKRTPWSVLPMGLCRVTLGAAALSMMPLATPLLPVYACWLGAVLAHVVGLSLLARGEARGHLSRPGLALLALPVLLAGVVHHWLAWDLRNYLFIGILWAVWMHRIWLTLRTRTDPARIGAAVAQLLAGLVVVDFLFAAPVDWRWAWVWLGLFALSLWWQRRVAAT